MWVNGADQLQTGTRRRLLYPRQRISFANSCRIIPRLQARTPDTRKVTMASVARALLRNNVKAVFGIPGTHTVPIYRGLQALDDRISTYTTRHEAGAGYAADGYARATGEVRACVSIRRPLDHATPRLSLSACSSLT